MVNQVGNFVFQLGIIAVFCGDYRFRALFSYLFQYFINSLIEQISGVRALFRIFPAVLDHIIHILQHVIVHFYISLSSRL